MSTAIELAYDPDGTNPDNRRENEQHVVSPPTKINDQSVIIPRLAPFHADPTLFKVYVGTAENKTPLSVGVDYHYVYRHHAASNATGRDIYGGILLTNRSFNGNIWLTYQSIGGPLVLDDVSIVERFSRAFHNVMYVSWEQFTGLPSAWPVADHPVDGLMLYGLEQVGAELNSIAAAINAKNSGVGAEPIANAHIISQSAHTPAQVGLNNLNNWATGTANDYVVGTNNAYATPLGVKTYLDARLANLSVTALEDRMDAMDLTLGNINQQLSTHANTFTQMADAIQTAERKVADVETTVTQQNTAIQNLTDAVGAATTDIANNKVAVNDHTVRLNAQDQTNATLVANDATHRSELDILNARAALSNIKGTIPDGTHTLILSPNSEMAFTMVGHGGQGSIATTDPLKYHPNNERPGSAFIFICTNVDDGTKLATPELLVNVMAGRSGQPTIDSTFGDGGQGGMVTVNTHAIVKDVTKSNGMAGANGTVDDSGASVGGTGHLVSGVTYGAGAGGEPLAGTGTGGAGGSGGWVEFKLKNESAYWLSILLVTSLSPVSHVGDNAGLVKIT